MPHKTRLGTFSEGSLSNEPYKAFLPPLLPPQPAIDRNEIFLAYDKAVLNLGRLDGIGALLPDLDLFLFMYVRKEAVLSSQIEGTQSSLSDLLLFEDNETAPARMNDVKEVSAYVRAIDHGMERLKSGFPLSLRLIKEMHGFLLADNRGKDKMPGEFRRSQNWVGGYSLAKAVFVPPPPDKVSGYLDNLEKFLHDETSPYPPLIRAAIMHVQFETIHPFLDGNGRMGRLLIPLLLCQCGVLKDPLLYLSLFLKKHKNTYYELLQEVRLNGAWEKWIDFFLAGVAETAEQAYTTAINISDLFKRNQELLGRSGRKSPSGLTIHHHFMKHPYSSIAGVHEGTGISEPAIIKTIRFLESEGIVREITGKKRNRLFEYKDYIDLLDQGLDK